MPAIFKKLENEPVVIITLPSEYNLAVELPKSMPKYLGLLDAATEPLYWIVDASQAALKAEEIILGTSLVARGERPLYRHPNIRQVIYVTTSHIMKLAAEGLKGNAFGHVNIKLFDDLDQALEYTRQKK
jgi:hypothetical protein